MYDTLVNRLLEAYNQVTAQDVESAGAGHDVWNVPTNTNNTVNSNGSQAVNVQDIVSAPGWQSLFTAEEAKQMEALMDNLYSTGESNPNSKENQAVKIIQQIEDTLDTPNTRPVNAQTMLKDIETKSNQVEAILKQPTTSQAQPTTPTLTGKQIYTYFLTNISLPNRFQAGTYGEFLRNFTKGQTVQQPGQSPNRQQTNNWSPVMRQGKLYER